MKSEYLVLDIGEVKTYLRGRENIGNTKDYELAAALLLAKHHYKETGEEQKIAIRVKQKLTDINDLSEALSDKHRKEDDIDVYLIPSTADLSAREKVKASPFQLKRFFLSGEGSGKKLLEYLVRDIPKKYPGGGDGILALIFRGIGNFSAEDFKNVNTVLKSVHNYPFGRILFVTGENGVRIIFGELFPKWGHKSYSSDEWLE